MPRSWMLPGLLGAALGAGVGHSTGDDLPQPHRTLRVENPGGLQLELFRRRGPSDELVAEGRATALERRLPCGRYWLRAGAAAWPAPLLESLPDAPLVVHVAPAPAVPDGMVAIPGGTSLQGDELGIGQPDEGPARLVTLPAFALGRDEVTNAEFVRFLDAAGDPGEWIALDSATCRIRLDARTRRFTTDAPDLPVVNVSWHGARAYCAWLRARTGLPYRLPREAEWEKAARGPASSVFAYGDRYAPHAANQESGTLRPASAFAAHGYGLRDMTGNAYEWCADSYSEGYRVLRGGSFVLDGVYLRNSFRMRYRPTVMSDDIGFRVALDLKSDNR